MKLHDDQKGMLRDYKRNIYETKLTNFTRRIKK